MQYFFFMYNSYGPFNKGKFTICSDYLFCLFTISNWYLHNQIPIYFIDTWHLQKPWFVSVNDYILTWISVHIGRIRRPYIQLYYPYASCMPFIFKYIFERLNDNWDQPINNKFHEMRALSWHPLLSFGTNHREQFRPDMVFVNVDIQSYLLNNEQRPQCSNSFNM